MPGNNQYVSGRFGRNSCCDMLSNVGKTEGVDQAFGL